MFPSIPLHHMLNHFLQAVWTFPPCSCPILPTLIITLPLLCPSRCLFAKWSHVFLCTPLSVSPIYPNTFPIPLLQQQLSVGEEKSVLYRSQMWIRDKESLTEFTREEKKSKSAEWSPSFSIPRYPYTFCCSMRPQALSYDVILCSWSPFYNVRGQWWLWAGKRSRLVHSK